VSTPQSSINNNTRPRREDGKVGGTKSSMAVSYQKSQRQILMDERAILENKISHEKVMVVKEEHETTMDS
jgi:hypothetical protein